MFEKISTDLMLNCLLCDTCGNCRQAALTLSCDLMTFAATFTVTMCRRGTWGFMHRSKECVLRGCFCSHQGLYLVTMLLHSVV